MTSIETKLRELELSVINAKSFERNRQRAVAHGMKPDIPITLKIETAEMLIAALKVAVSEFQMIRCTYFSPEQIAERALTSIEKILNGGK